MTIAVAHHATTVTDAILIAAVQQASAFGEPLAVINVIKSTDLDQEAALELGISDKVEAAKQAAGVSDVTWNLHLVSTSSDSVDEVAEAVLAEVVKIDPRLLVIGARRRSPIGKAFLGSVTQHLVLDADVPVLVVKPALESAS